MNPTTANKIYYRKPGKTKSSYSSPVASDGSNYIVDEEGKVYVFQDGNVFKMLAEIPLNDPGMVAP